MSRQYYRRSASYFKPLFALFLMLGSGSLGFRRLLPSFAQAQTVVQEEIRQIDSQLRDPGLLLLRSGTFDPLLEEPPAIRIGQRQMETTSLTARSSRLAARQAKPSEEVKAYYIVQYGDRILPTQSARLRTEGSEIVGYLANNAFIVRAGQRGSTRLLAARQRGEFRWLGAYGAGLKVEPRLVQMADASASGSSPAAGPVEVSFLTFRGESAAQIRQAIAGLSMAAEPNFEERADERTWGLAFVEPSDLPDLIAALTSVEGIEWIEQRQRHRLRNDTGVRVVQTGIAGTDTPLYRHGLTGEGQTYGTADSGLDGDHAQFKLDAQASSQTLSLSVTTRSLINGLLPVSITNTNNKVLAYYVLGSGDLIDNPANPHGGKSLDPNQSRRGGSSPSYLNGVAYDDSDGGYHGTGTASVAVGRAFHADGTGGVPGVLSRTTGDGVAPDARLVFQDVGHPSGQLSGVDTISQLLVHEQAYRSGVRVHNNSYGPSPPISYNQDAADIDDIMWRLRDYTVFYSAGNDGSAARRISNSAKNDVVVAATGSPTTGGDIESLASYSSHGPTSDGRIKPDIAAPGTVLAATENNGVTSTFGSETSRTASDAGVNPVEPDNNQSLALTSGTSFSSPMVAGGALLVRQYFTDGYYPYGARGSGDSFIPSNALVKAIILNSGRNMTGRYTASVGTGGASGPLPNFGQGWGRIALDDTLHFVGDRRQLRVIADIFNGAMTADSSRPASNPAITTGQTHTYPMIVGSSTEPLRVSLVWSDPRALVGAQVALVNNLDLELTDPEGNVYRGNANFTNAYSRPANGAAFDNRNPVEAIYIASPATGTYIVRVIGANIPGNGSSQVLASPGNQPIDSDRQGYALIATANLTAGPPVATNTSTSVDAASFARVSAPGEILAAFGTGFPVSTVLSSAASSTPLPTLLGGVSVRVNGILAPLFFAGVGGGIGAGSFQINYQLPYEVSPGTAFVEVLHHGIAIASENLTVSSAAPGVFTVAANGQGQAAALNQDLSPNGSPGVFGSSRAEARGRYLIVFANGQGGQFINPESGQGLTIASGQVAPGGVLYSTATMPTVTIGGVQATVGFSGLAPGYVGLWQLNVLIPSSAPTGTAVPLNITTGGQTSGSVTVAIN